MRLRLVGTLAAVPWRGQRNSCVTVWRWRWGAVSGPGADARLVGPSDAPALVASIHDLLGRRGTAVVVDAWGTIDDVLGRLRAVLDRAPS